MPNLFKQTAYSFAITALMAGVAAGDFLKPGDYNSLGVLSSADDGRINTDGTPTLIVGGTTYTGVVAGGIAVFDFNSIALSGTLEAHGSRPLALLSRGGITLATGSALDFLAGANMGGPGVGGAGHGYEFEANGASYFASTGSGGGGFGGHGTNGAEITGPFPSGVPGAGGPTYGDLAKQLEGGSAGGGGASAGAGGGAVELGALGAISILGEIHANGGGEGIPGEGGGGSGGGILIHGDSVAIAGTITADGGFGGGELAFSDSYLAPSGDGGGGRILIQAGSGGLDLTGTLSASGHGGAGDGVITIASVPEPSAALLLAAGLLAVAVRRHRRRGSA